ncbi:MAG: hypothetical protein ABIL09_24005 [Gemmatimonadota bacterium]
MISEPEAEGRALDDLTDEELADLEAVVAEVERAERRERGRQDPAWFLKYYLPHLFPQRFAVFHLEIIADYKGLIEESLIRGEAAEVAGPTSEDDWRDLDVEADEGDQEDLTEDEWRQLEEEAGTDAPVRCEAIAAPRQHAKSTIGEGMLLWVIAYHLRNFPLVCSDTVGQASDRLGTVRTEIETNERLHEDFPDLGPGKRWTETDAITTTGVRAKCYGIRTRLRGAKHGRWRPDLAWLDEAENDEFVATEPQRQKTRDWLVKVLIPSLDTDRGVVVMQATILHFDSLLARAVGPDHFVSWRKRRYQALNKDTGGKLTALWPSRWSVARLLEEKASIGTVAFEAEYNNNPVSDETALFRLAWIDQCKDRRLRFVGRYEDIVAALGGVRPLFVVDGWDFGWTDDKSKAEERDSNYTVGWSVAVHPETRHRYLVLGFRDRGLPPSEVKAAVKAQAARVRPPAEAGVPYRVGVENVGLQRQLYEVGLQQETDLPVRGILTGRQKMDLYQGVPSLSALFEGGQYHLPWPEGADPESRNQRELVQTLCNELWGLGKEAHDDCALALWFTEVLISRMIRAVDARRRGSEQAQQVPQPKPRPAQEPAQEPADVRVEQLEPVAGSPVAQPGLARISTRRIGTRAVGG